MKKMPAKRGTARTKNRTTKDLPATKTRTVSGGSTSSNLMKARHDTVKNSISNVR